MACRQRRTSDARPAAVAVAVAAVAEVGNARVGDLHLTAAASISLYADL